MTKKQKRLQRLRQNPKTVSFQELEQVLLDFGFMLKRSEATSHHLYEAEIDKRKWVLLIPYKRPYVNSVYVKQSLRIIDEIIAIRQQLDLSDEDET